MLTEKNKLINSMYHSVDIAYCSNVHAGETLAEIIKNLSRFVKKVRQRRGLESMTSGLWLSAAAAEELQTTDALKEFKQALNCTGLSLTSINGFPYGGFHQEQLKAGVYTPDWSDSARLRYTQHLAEVLISCLPESVDLGVISTVPLGYKQDWSFEKQQKSVENLTALMIYLFELEQRTGKRVLLCLEMEPDCVLESSDELVQFFQEVVQKKIPHNQYLGCCYDVCHQAVMYEDTYASLQRITSAGINIGKIQLSSALQVRIDASTREDDQLIVLLKQFCEPKYLHQVKKRDEKGRLSADADLPLALAALTETDSAELQTCTWRIHFHVPVNFQHLTHEKLQTTCDDLLKVFDFLRDNPAIRPRLEVETYSWQVLPERVRPGNDDELIDGITNELRWVETQLANRALVCNAKDTHVKAEPGRC